MIEQMAKRNYARYSVLLVDDEPFVRSVVKRMLIKLGFNTISEASNGHEALAILDGLTAPVDMVICDLNMPDMDGIELVRHLSERPALPAIAFLSGANQAVLNAACSLGKARRLQVLGSLTKPVRQDGLISVLEGFNHEYTPRARREIPRISEADLERGIEDRELLFHFQPKVSVRDRRLVAVEALARWNHPDFGLLHPTAFIGVAGSGPLIEPLTRQLFEIGFRQLAEWRGAGLDLDLSINLSSAVLSDTNLPDTLASLAAAHSLPPSKVTLDVTETSLPKDDALYTEILTRLHMRGFVIAIDDFGTGHSSLLKLATLPFSELKIDRAFVNGASGDATKRAILEAAIRLAKSLGLTVVGEGVENATDWHLLADLECDLAQGYYLARPLPADALQTLAVGWAREEQDCET